MVLDTLDNNQSVVALDYGDKRIGVALASKVARLPSPLITLPNDTNFKLKLNQIISENNVETVVVGYPRDMNGNVTNQTKIVEDFIENLKLDGLNIETQDEALTSNKAEAELDARGGIYSKEDVDALAATYILDDWLNSFER